MRWILCLVAWSWSACGTCADVAVTEHAYRSALTVIEAAFDAHGGRSTIDAVGALTLELDGTHGLPLQNRAIDFARDPLRKKGEIAVSGANVAYEEHIERPGIYTGRHRLVFDGKEAFDLNLRSRQYRASSAPAIALRIDSYLPHRLLATAYAQRQSLRLLDSTDGADADAVSFAHPTGRTLTLVVDRRSKRVREMQSLASLPLLGDAVTRQRYDDYAAIGGVLVPGRRVSSVNGSVSEDVSIVARRGVTADAFRVPAGFARRDDTQTRAQKALAVSRIAEGVVVVTNPNGTDASVLAVERDEATVVAGAPADVGDEVFSAIARAFPGKPIGLVVPTHHHADHAGGVRDYIARGVPVLARPTNAAFFASLPARPHTLDPDALALAPRAALVETMTGRRHVVSGPGRRVEVLDIGPTSHAEEMLIVYLPREHVVFQSDLLEIDDDDAVDANTANAVTVEFLERIDALGLQVETIVGAEGRIATRADLERAVALRASGERWSDEVR